MLPTTMPHPATPVTVFFLQQRLAARPSRSSLPRYVGSLVLVVGVLTHSGTGTRSTQASGLRDDSL